MQDNPFTKLIREFIAAREQPKLEDFDKKAEKRRKERDTQLKVWDTDLELELTEKLQQIKEKYKPAKWITDAANRAKQRQIITHALKFSHPDAKGSSIFSINSEAAPDTDFPGNYISTSILDNPTLDSVGNAAALDIVAFLQLEHDGKKLLDCIRADDFSPLRPFASDDNEAKEWLSDFKSIFDNDTLSSHKYAKQIYFPVGEEQYHLLSPIYPSSLAQAIYERISSSRYSDEAKTGRKARRELRWHDEIVTDFPNTAVIHHGGTKPQNISQLNSSRRGRSFLLPYGPPIWQTKLKPPLGVRTVFSWSHYGRHVGREVMYLKSYLHHQIDKPSTIEVRDKRGGIIDDLIDKLIQYGATIQQLRERAGWSDSSDCRLSRAEQLWLDPYRCEMEQNFKVERETKDWQEEIANKFSIWLNRRISSERLGLGDQEYSEWRSLVKRKMRLLKEDLEDFS